MGSDEAEPDQPDFDAHPEITRAAVLLAARMNAAHLRLMARDMHKTPAVTAQQALLAAADAIMRSAANWAAAQGSADNTREH